VIAFLNHRLGQPHLGPGQVAFGRHLFEHPPCFFGLATIEQQLRLELQQLNLIRLVEGQPLVAQLDSTEVILVGKPRGNFGERLFFGPDFRQSQPQRSLGDRLQNIGIGLVFRSAHHNVIGLFGGDHHPRAGWSDEVAVPGFFEYLLAVLAVSKVVVAQHNIVFFVFQHRYRFDTGSDGIDKLHVGTAGPQDVAPGCCACRGSRR